MLSREAVSVLEYVCTDTVHTYLHVEYSVHRSQFAATAHDRILINPPGLDT